MSNGPEKSQTWDWLPDVLRQAQNQGISGSQVVNPNESFQTLVNQGWTPEAANWFVSKVLVTRAMNPDEIGPDARPMPEGATGAYYGGNPGSIRLPGSAVNWAPNGYAHVLEHEAMHAWEMPGNPGGSMGINRVERMQDFDSANGVMNNLNLSKLLATLGLHDPTWKDQGSRTSPQLDEAHYTQTLFNEGFNQDDVPNWYRAKYMNEYGGQ